MSASSGPKSEALPGHPLPELSQRGAPGLDTKLQRLHGLAPNSKVPHDAHSEYLRVASCRRPHCTFHHRTVTLGVSACALLLLRASACAFLLARLCAATCWPRTKASEPRVVLSVSTAPKSGALPGHPRPELSQREAAGLDTKLQSLQGFAPNSKVPHHVHSE